jgi:hypothetical protein
VPTGVVVREHLAFIASDNDDGIVLCLVNKIIPGFGDFGCGAYKQPILFPDVLPLDIEDLGVGIESLC